MKWLKWEKSPIRSGVSVLRVRAASWAPCSSPAPGIRNSTWSLPDRGSSPATTLYGVLKLGCAAPEAECNPAAGCTALPAVADKTEAMHAGRVDLSSHPASPSRANPGSGKSIATQSKIINSICLIIHRSNSVRWSHEIQLQVRSRSSSPRYKGITKRQTALTHAIGSNESKSWLTPSSCCHQLIKTATDW